MTIDEIEPTQVSPRSRARPENVAGATTGHRACPEGHRKTPIENYPTCDEIERIMRRSYLAYDAGELDALIAREQALEATRSAVLKARYVRRRIAGPLDR